MFTASTGHRIAQSHCVITLCNHIAQSHCKIALRNRIAQSHCAIALCNHIVQSHCAIPLCNRIAQSHCSITLHNRIAQSHSAIALCNRIVQPHCTSHCAIALHNHIAHFAQCLCCSRIGSAPSALPSLPRRGAGRSPLRPKFFVSSAPPLGRNKVDGIHTSVASPFFAFAAAAVLPP